MCSVSKDTIIVVTTVLIVLYHHVILALMNTRLCKSGSCYNSTTQPIVYTIITTLYAVCK